MSASCVTNWKSKLLRGFYSRRAWCSQEERARGEESTSPVSRVGQTHIEVDTESCTAYITGTVDIASRPDAHFAIGIEIRQQSCALLFDFFFCFPSFSFLVGFPSYFCPTTPPPSRCCFLYFFRCDDVGGSRLIGRLNRKKEQIK